MKKVYYALILLTVLMFGGCFALKDVYRKQRGSNLKISLQFTCISSVAGLVVLIAINGFKFEYTPFTLLMALLVAINGFLFSFCSFKALDSVNLSVYSLFSMLGGMALPFVQGIAFYGEPMTVAKSVCFVIITVALLITVEKGEKKNGTPYYIGVFVLNGMSGVLSKIYASSNFEKASAAGYSILSAICSVVLSALILAIFFRAKDDTPKENPLSVAVCAASGITNKVANFILVIALSHVDASVQYPMVTGGVMIVSTLICFFGDKKPSKREVLSIAVAFIGMLALFLIKC